jgi:hypothetical protein
MISKATATFALVLAVTVTGVANAAEPSPVKATGVVSEAFGANSSN